MSDTSEAGDQDRDELKKHDIREEMDKLRARQ